MFRLIIFIVLALVLAGAVMIAVAGTYGIATSWMHSHRSISSFEAHVRHYTDRIVIDGDTWYVVRVAHPFVLFLGTVCAAWLIAAACASALHRLLMQPRRSKIQPLE